MQKTEKSAESYKQRSSSYNNSTISVEQQNKCKNAVIDQLDQIVKDMSKDGQQLSKDTKDAYAELRNALKKAAPEKLCQDLHIQSEPDAKQFVDNVKLNW